MPNTREKQIKEKLIELIGRSPCVGFSSRTAVERIADNLIANGVTFATGNHVAPQLMPMGAITYAIACSHCKNRGADAKKCEQCRCEVKSWFEFDSATVQEWISVKDRVPDTAERVLVSETWLGTVRKPQYGYFQKHPNQEGCWYILTDHGYYPRTSTEITHWMPMPPAPKGE